MCFVKKFICALKRNTSNRNFKTQLLFSLLGLGHRGGGGGGGGGG